MSYLLDTNVVSEVTKPSPNSNVSTWFNSVPDSELFISVLVLGEIRQGVERLRPRDLQRAATYESFLHDIRRRFEGRIIPITVEVAEEWGRLNSRRTISPIDAFLAATAIARGLTLVTRNTRDVADTGVSLLDPFEPAT